MAKAIAWKARHDVKMDVKNLLTGRRAVCQEKIDALRFQT